MKYKSNIGHHDFEFNYLSELFFFSIFNSLAAGHQVGIIFDDLLRFLF